MAKTVEKCTTTREMLYEQCFPIPRDKVVNLFIVKTANVVNFFTITTGKHIQ